MRFYLRFFVAVGFLWASGAVRAQNVGNSPYSQIGIGDITNPAFAPQQAMGSAGVAYTNGLFINNLNPALWARNRNVVLELGVAAQYTRLTSGGTAQRNVGGNLNYLALAFPVARFWTSGLTLEPYSTVNYDIRTTSTVAGRPTKQVNTTLTGRGGLAGVSFNNGFALTKSLYAGLQTTYVFGSATNSVFGAVDSLLFSTAGYQQRINYSDFVFKPGLAYRKRLRYDSKDSLKAVYLSIAGTYDFASNVSARRTLTSENRGASVDGAPILLDTLVDGQTGNVRLPQGFRLGLNIENPFRWAVSADVAYRRWSDYSSFGTSGALMDTYSVHLGGEWTPNINSVGSYLRRMTFRAGIQYSQMPIAHQGRQLSDRSVSLGVFLPITPQDRSGVSYINTTFILGRRGEESLIKENYVRMVFGFSLNSFEWFRRYKID